MNAKVGSDKSGPADSMQMLPETADEYYRRCRARLEAFWAGQCLGRPAIHITAARNDFDPLPTSAADPIRRDRDVSTYVERARQAVYAQHYFAEAVPYAFPAFGANLMTLPVLAGEGYEYHDGKPWIRRNANIWRRDVPIFDAADKFVRFIDAALEQMAAEAGENAIIGPPAFLDALTVLSELRGTEDFLTDLSYCPAIVDRWNEALTDLYLQAYEHFYRKVTDLGYGRTQAWLPVLADGKMEAVQCDVGVMLSPQMFERFAMPALRRITQYLDYSLYHMDGTCQMRFLDQLATLEDLDGIQFNIEPGAGSPVEWIDAYRHIRERGLSIMVFCTPDQGIEITRRIGGDGLMLVMGQVESEDEALKAIEDIELASRT